MNLFMMVALGCGPSQPNDTGPGTSDPCDVGGEPSLPGLTWVNAPDGKFTMGCTQGQDGQCDPNEYAAHAVEITRSFCLSTTEVTQLQWESLTADARSPNDRCGDDCPVEMVTWLDVVGFANELSELDGLERCYVMDGEDVTWPEGLDCEGYRLPTEAEWEYAARAGTDTMFAGSDVVGEVAWSYENAESQNPVGSLSPNAWGLYDMSGNVWEWTWDWHNGGPYASGPVDDPMGAETGTERVLRGGGYVDVSAHHRVTCRRGRVPSDTWSAIGFRLARSDP